MAVTYTAYPNEVVENKINEFLATKVDANPYLTLDQSLVAAPGMIKTIRKYTKAGTAVEVGPGEDVTAASGTQMSVGWEDKSYTVKVMQQEFVAHDEDQWQDPKWVETGIESIGEAIWNAYQQEAFTEWEKSTNIIYTGVTGQAKNAVSFNNFVDAIAEMDLEDVDERGITAFVNPAMKAELRKNLKDDLKYSEGYVRTGYIGHVAGIPVVTSKLVTDDKVIICTPEAVTAFVKRGVSASQDRDNAHRTTTYVGNQSYIIALTNEAKCVLITKGAKPEAGTV